MRQCQKCYAPNNDESQYCESCGTPLRHDETSRPTAMFYQQEANSQQTASPIQYPVPEPIYTPRPPAPGYTQNYAPTQLAFRGKIASAQKSERKRSGISLFLGILLYLAGGFIAAFGLASIFMKTRNDTIVGTAFIIGCLISLLVLVSILTRHPYPRLRDRRRAVVFGGMTLVALIALVAVFATYQGNQTTMIGQYIAMGIICLAYGVGMEIIALL